MAKQKLNYQQMGTIAFKAKRTNSAAVSAGGGVTIVYDSVHYDYGSNYNASNGFFTAPVNGIYQFTAAVNTESTAVGRAFIQSTGTAILGNNPNATGRSTERTIDIDSSAERRISGAWELYMAAGETFGIQIYIPTAMNVADGSTFFAGHLVMKV